MFWVLISKQCRSISAGFWKLICEIQNCINFVYTVFNLSLMKQDHCNKNHFLTGLSIFAETLHENLDRQLEENFPGGNVKLIRLPKRVGLIVARLEGLKHVTAEVVSFFDCHMEVNVGWWVYTFVGTFYLFFYMWLCNAFDNVLDCRFRGHKFDPSLVPYFRGDWSWNNFYGHSPPFHWFKKGFCQLQAKVYAQSTG